MKIRSANSNDILQLAEMRHRLWPATIGEHQFVLQDYFSGKPSHIDQIIVSECRNSDLIGFVELRVRNYAEGSENFRVPFLEGWYVARDWRGQGWGRRLIAEAEKWALSLGYTELASNALLDNIDSIAAHQALGFKEIERAVHFLKTLNRND